MRNFTKFLCLSLSSTICATTLPLVCCSQPTPEKKGLELIEPLQKTISGVVDNDGKMTTWFNGFQYEHDSSMIFDINKLKVSHTFGDPFKVTIDRHDATTKTFSIRIEYTEIGTPIASATGQFGFTYEDKPIEGFSSSTFTINIMHNSKIIMPSSRSVQTNLDNEGNATIVFNGFQYTGDDIDDNNLFVSNTFSQASCGATFESNIIDFVKQNKTFNVEIKITGAMPATSLTGQLTFFYGESIVPKSDDGYFEIELDDVITITKPTGEKSISEGFVQDGEVSLLFKGFQFTGLDDSEQITVTSEDFNEICTTQGWTPTYTICNWDITAKSFDVQLNISGITSLANLDNFAGDLTFNLASGETIPTTESTFTGIIKYAVPRSLLAFETDSSGNVILKGFAEGGDISHYNTLLIPAETSIISTQAFQGKIREGSPIKYLDFAAGCVLNEIQDLAFENCINLNQKDLHLPLHISSIGNRAFFGCTNLTGSINFPLTSVHGQINVGSHAFAECTHINKIIISRVVVLSDNAFTNCKNISTIDLSHMDPNVIPTWLQGDTARGFFWQAGKDVCTTTNKGQVFLPKNTSSETIDQWITQLNIVGELNILAEQPDESIWECKVID